jgi:hypothetical protein
MMINYLGTVPRSWSAGHLVHSSSGAGISLGPEPEGDERVEMKQGSTLEKKKFF